MISPEIFFAKYNDLVFKVRWRLITRKHLGLYSLSCKTTYRKISWSLEAARFGFKLFQSLWNLQGTSAAALPRCLSNFRAILPLQRPISRLRDFTRSCGKTSYRLVNRGPEWNESAAILQMAIFKCIFERQFVIRFTFHRSSFLRIQ